MQAPHTIAAQSPLPVLRRLLALVLSGLIALGLLVQPSAAQELADWDTAGGHFYSQAGGYSVVDDGDGRMWSELQRQGGVGRLGYPVSRRFAYKGFTVQAFQKVVLQWVPGENRAAFLNVFDDLSAAGKDDWLLQVRQTPRPVKLDETGKSFDQIVAIRQALLDANPAIREAYFASSSPLEDYGLPTSEVTDLGPVVVLRTQRAAFQQWKSDTAWARAGEVVVANGGDVFKEAGLVPAAALEKEDVGPPDPPELAQINAYRVVAGVTPARLNPALLKATENHVNYYQSNKGDPSLAGMGLNTEKQGAPGFTGVSIGDRARAAGYSGGTVTENAGFGGIPAATDWYMNTVNHRLPLIHPSALDIGYAQAPDGFHIIDVGLRRDRLTVDLPSVYPPAGATGVPVSWDGAETPDPAPGIPRPLGYPITVAFGTYQRVEWQSFELLGPGGESLTVSTPKTDWMRAAAIVPHSPLQHGTTYTVRVGANVDGKPLTKEWSFTTG